MGGVRTPVVISLLWPRGCLCRVRLSHRMDKLASPACRTLTSHACSVAVIVLAPSSHTVLADLTGCRWRTSRRWRCGPRPTPSCARHCRRCSSCPRTSGEQHKHRSTCARLSSLICCLSVNLQGGKRGTRQVRSVPRQPAARVVCRPRRHSGPAVQCHTGGGGPQAAGRCGVRVGVTDSEQRGDVVCHCWQQPFRQLSGVSQSASEMVVVAGCWLPQEAENRTSNCRPSHDTPTQHERKGA